MSIRPSVPEIITVNSEALQTQIRDLLPSQNGFGSELQASNVIFPVIDLTSAAEGSSVAQNLQTALSYGSQTSFNIANTTTTLTSNPGFYRITGGIYSTSAGGTANSGFTATDGATPKDVLMVRMSGGVTGPVLLPFDFIFFVGTGITLSGKSAATTVSVTGSFRQIADSAGTLVNPVGFPT